MNWTIKVVIAIYITYLSKWCTTITNNYSDPVEINTKITTPDKGIGLFIWFVSDLM